ncbi:MAG: tetratricopeptide repeat protein, partial [Phycisphaerae bacterium]
MDTIPSHDEPTDGPSGRRPERAARARTFLALTAVAGLALAFGRPTRHGAFLMGDDQRFVTEHVLVNHPSLAHAWELLTIVHGDLWQPLPLLSFQANYAMAARDPHRRFGIDPLVFHLTNIGLHMVNAVLACLVALRLSRRLPVALLTGLMFACHPLALEPVAWVSGRMILLATAFSLATLWVCLGRRRDARGRWPLWAGLLWACSLLSKVLPTVPLAAAWSDRRLHGRLPRRAWLVYGAFFVLGLVLSLQAFRATARAGFTDGGGRETHASAPVRWILAVRYGLENYVWPSRLSPWSPPPQGIGLTSRSVWVGLLECGAFLLVLPVAGKRSPTVLLGLVLFAILLAPFLAASTARRLLVADRYFYLPLLGLHLATAAAAVQMADRIKRRFSRKVAVAGVSSVGAIVLALWTWTGWRLAPTWSDSIHLYERAAAIYPESVLARAEWAKACNFQGRPDLALAIVEEARRRWPDHPRLAAQAGHAYRLENDDIRAEAELRAAVAAMPQHLSTAYAYALVLDALGRRDAARRQYVRILGLNPDFLPAITALARADLAAGETDRAIAGFERALRVNPHHRESLFQLARLRMGRGELRRAAALLRRILDLDPDDGPARFNLAVVLFRSGAHEAALDLCDRLRREDPTNQSILVNRANVLAAL